jgi:predicted HTH transcriptional regulator
MRIFNVLLVVILVINASYAIAQNTEGEYYFFRDGSDSNTTNREKFKELCSKTESMDTMLFSLGSQFADFNSYKLIEEAGNGVASLEDIYVSKSGDCFLNFKVNGVYKGTTVNSDIYCKATMLKEKSKDKFVVKMVDSTNCFKK